MSHPLLHSKSSVKKFGGKVEDYIHLHNWMDETKAWVGHSSITETMDTYGHLFPDSMLDLADKLDAYALQESNKLEKKTA
jgi:integrase